MPASRLPHAAYRGYVLHTFTVPLFCAHTGKWLASVNAAAVPVADFKNLLRELFPIVTPD